MRSVLTTGTLALGALLLASCVGSILSPEAHEAFLARQEPVSVTVYPVHVVKGAEIEHDADLWMLDLPGRSWTQVTGDTRQDLSPVVARDGSRLAFLRASPGVDDFPVLFSEETQVGELGNAVFREQALELHLVGGLVGEIELGVEANGPLVEKRYVVGLLLRREPVHQPLVHLRGPPQHV